MTIQQGDERRTLGEFNHRVHFYEPPPENFDPRTAEPEVRAKHGIPPKPNERDFPMLAEFWTEMFSPPLVFAETRFALMAAPMLISNQLRMSTRGQRESSLNWSGAYVTPRNGGQLTEVHGRWEVPSVMPPSGTSGSPEFRSSIWIGFDGQRRYFDASLPQIGTAQFLNAPATVQPFSVWCQWWLRDNSITYEPVLLDLPIARGHRIMASLRVLNETQVHFLIENRTTGAIFPPFILDAPISSALNIQAKVSGATAEWIVERPTRADSAELYELPDYGEVLFTNCFAIGSGLEQTLYGARPINMYKVERNPSRTVFISKVEGLRQHVDSFKTTFTG